MYVLKGKPLDVHGAQSVLESLEGLQVKARNIAGNVVVTKREILRRLKEKKSMFLPCWKKFAANHLSFPLTNCTKLN